MLLGVLVEVIVLFGTLQRATLATSAAAREVGRAVVLSDSARRRCVALGRRDRPGRGEPRPRAETPRTPSVDGQLARGAHLRVTVSTEVPLLRIPFIGPVWPSLSVPVEATHVVQVDRYRSFP